MSLLKYQVHDENSQVSHNYLVPPTKILSYRCGLELLPCPDGYLVVVQIQLLAHCFLKVLFVLPIHFVLPLQIKKKMCWETYWSNFASIYLLFNRID